MRAILVAALLVLISGSALAQEPVMEHRFGPGPHFLQNKVADYPRAKERADRHVSRKRHDGKLAKPVEIPQTHERVARYVAEKFGDIVTVPTAAGINITVARSAASKFQGLIADLVASGYKPDRIHCFANSGHVRRSYHYSGEACDIDNRANRRNLGRFRFAEIIAKHGLRDGCSFRYAGVPDCGHVDTGSRRLAAIPAQPHPFLGARHAALLQ